MVTDLTPLVGLGLAVPVVVGVLARGVPWARRLVRHVPGTGLRLPRVVLIDASTPGPTPDH